MQCIQFKDGFAMATDAYTFVRWKYTDLIIDPDNLANGKLIHSAQFKKLRKDKGPYVVTEAGISADNGRVVFQWETELKFPDWEKNVFKFDDPSIYRENVVNLGNMARLYKAFKQFIDPGFGVVVCERKSNYIIYPYHGGHFVAIIMKMNHLATDAHEPEAFFNP